MEEIFIQEGKDVEDAISKALTKLNVSRDEIEYEVLDEGNKGILNFIGIKPAKIKVQLINRKSGSEIVKIAQNIIEKMGLKSKSMSHKKEGNVFFVDIEMEEQKDILIGKNGDTMGALQHIISRIINSNNDDERIQVVVDVNGYRKEKDRELINNASIIAEKVKRTGKEIMMNPLHPPDRKVVYSALNKDPDIRTYTVGSGIYKNIVVASAKKSKREDDKKVRFKKEFKRPKGNELRRAKIQRYRRTNGKYRRTETRKTTEKSEG